MDDQEYTREELIAEGNRIIYDIALEELAEAEKKRLGETPLQIGLRAYQRSRELERYDQETPPVDNSRNAQPHPLTQSLADYFKKKGNL